MKGVLCVVSWSGGALVYVGLFIPILTIVLSNRLRSTLVTHTLT